MCFVLESKFSFKCQAVISNWVRGHIYGLSLPLLPYFVYVRRDESGQTAPMHRLIFGTAPFIMLNFLSLIFTQPCCIWKYQNSYTFVVWSVWMQKGSWLKLFFVWASQKFLILFILNLDIYPILKTVWIQINSLLRSQLIRIHIIFLYACKYMIMKIVGECSS